MEHRPKILELTVPHSGTRYIRGAFQSAGYKTTSAYLIPPLEESKPDFVFAHYSHIKEETLEEVAKAAQNILVVVRDPIMTWATNWLDFEMMPHIQKPERKRKTQESHQFTLETAWRIQNEIISKYNPHIHRVDKDSLEDLEKWAGTKFTQEPNRYSKSNRLKEQIESRNVERIEQLAPYYWKWFKEEATPIFKDLYKKLGYDIWWDE